MRTNKNRFAKRVAVAAGFFFLCAAPGLPRAQTTPPTPAPIPRKTLPTVRPKKDTRPTDDFAGLQYTDEQKGRIDQIHEEMKSRMDITAKDEKLTAEQRDAMLAGYQSMLFHVFTKTFAISEGLMPEDRHMTRLYKSMNLERGLLLHAERVGTVRMADPAAEAEQIAIVDLVEHAAAGRTGEL